MRVVITEAYIQCSKLVSHDRHYKIGTMHILMKSINLTRIAYKRGILSYNMRSLCVVLPAPISCSWLATVQYKNLF